MEKLFKKQETGITIFFIVLYIVSNSFCMQEFGLTDVKTLILNVGLVVLIYTLIATTKTFEYYGLNSFPKPKKYLYFIPLILLASVNVWNGINIDNTIDEIIIHMGSMCMIGFLEEIIFRGFLFRILEKDSEKLAIIITSITFGVGHIINLLNGEPVIETLIQVVYAMAVGYLFAIILVKTKSLWPCIITHAAVNALSIFNVTNILSMYIVPIFVVIISISYAEYIRRKN